MTRSTPWAHRYYDEAPFGRGGRLGSGTVSDEERAIMDEILNAPEPVSLADLMCTTITAFAEEWGLPSPNPSPSRPASYAEYLRSSHWIATRQRALQRAGRRCQRCEKSNVRLEVHHLSYDRLGREREWDLTALCRSCHAAEHGKPTQGVTP